jgi:hypothetical protein
MAKVLCPYCGCHAHFAPRLFGLPYCVNCGWKLEDAEKSSRLMVVLLPMLVLLGLLPFFGGVLLGWEWPIRCLYLACFVLFPGSLALLSWMDYRTIIVAEPQTVSARPEDWTVRATARYEPFLNLPTPRVVRISRKGWLRVSVGAVCLGLALFVFLRQMRGAALPVGA